jgi:transcriptional regulator with XRE-family HTH domain
MNDTKGRSDIPVGRYLTLIREGAGLTQAQLGGKVTFSTASISRIESGDKDTTNEELAAILKAIGTAQAKQFGEYLNQSWDELDRPAFDHPNRSNLWEANLALRKLRELREDPDLKSVFVRQIDLYEKELRRLAHYLRSREHQIAFIGSIGVGKSTGICKLTGLLKQGEDRLDRQIVLETGAGGITLCEVHISHGPKYGLLIVPRSEDSIRKDVEDFCEYLIKTIRPDTATAKPVDDEEGDLLGISKEVVRAIRNMSGLTEKRKEEGGKRVRIDPAKELAQQFPKTQELAIQILTRMDLLRRNRRDAWYPDDSTHTPTQWLQQLFADVNNGRHPEFTLPQKIEVVVPDPVFATHDLPIKIIDTKGIDQTAERQDLECHFDDPRTLVVLCSRFNDAPEIAVQTLLQRAKEAGVKDIEPKTVVLVLARPDEALAVKYDDGTKVEDDREGYDLKRDQIEMPLKQKGLNALSVEFFNAKADSPETVRDRLVDKIVQYRADYSNQISRVAEAVEHLIENREDEQIRLVFEEIGRRLNTWIDKNREIDWPDLEVQEPLVAAIGGTRYASTIRAAVRRHGEWYNLDYFHQLAVGTRRIAVTQIGGKIRDFKVIVTNLIDDAELAPANEFLSRVVENLDASIDDAYRKLQIGGREAFREELEKDLEFWRECERRWGAGPGYRSAISEMTDHRFESSYDDAHELVKGLVSNEWKGIISLLEGMLREGESQNGDLAVKLLDASA